MKFLYIILNILFITVIVLTSRSLFAPEASKLSSISKKTQTPKTKSSRTQKKATRRTRKKLDANIAVKYNLFDPSRGNSADDTSTKLSQSNSQIAKQFKLVGVYRFGKIHGAVIISSNSGSRSRSRSKSRSRSTRRQTQPTTPQQKAKRFYRLGDVLDNGFVLKKVDTRTVLLSKGSESVILEIEHNNPIIRESSKPKLNAKRVSMKVSRPEYNRPEQMLRPSPTIIN
jgi:hypothetical protein